MKIRGDILEKLKVIELFAGVGSQRMALRNIGVEHEVVGISEFDKFAEKSYMAIHGDTINFGDITKIESLPTCDFLTYSFPCTDISVAGRQGGLSKGSGTRSGLLWEVERLLVDYRNKNKLPKYLMLENVKNLIGKKFKKDFDSWLSVLDDLGYNSYYKVLDAQDYGVPQSRKRVFVISILKTEDKGYEFPKAIPLKYELNDLILDEVEVKYYMTHKKAEDLINIVKCDKKGSFPSLTKNPMITSALSSREHRTGGWKEICSTLCARDYKDPKILAIPIDSTICKPKELSISNCITARCDGGIQNKQSMGVAIVEVGEHNFYLRKLTPLECWRLMGFSDKDFFKAEKVNSNTQLYKQAGNSIVVDVLEEIYKNLFIKN